MFEHEKRVEIERRVLKAGDDRAKAGLPPANPDTLRMIAAHELERELEARRARATPRLTPSRVAPPPAHPAKPLARPLTAAKPAVPAYLAAERARVSEIIAAAPPGLEAER